MGKEFHTPAIRPCNTTLATRVIRVPSVCVYWYHDLWQCNDLSTHLVSALSILPSDWMFLNLSDTHNAIYRIFNKTTRFCGHMFVLSPLAYPQWAFSRWQLTTGEAVVCRLREALGVIGIALHSVLQTAVSCWSHCQPHVDLPRSLYLFLNVCSQDYLSPPVHFTMTVPNVLGFFQLKSGQCFSTVKGSSTI
jgi:hypothetical protein